MRKLLVLPPLALVGGSFLIMLALAVAGFAATTAIAGGIFKSSDVGAHAGFHMVDGCIDTWVDVNANEFDFQSPPGPGPGGGPPWVSVNITQWDTCAENLVSFGWAGGEASLFSIDERDLTSAMAAADVSGFECPFFFDPGDPSGPPPGPCEPLHGFVDLDWTGEDGISTFRSNSHQTNPDGSKSNCHSVDKNRGATVAGTVDLDGNGFHDPIHFDGWEAGFAGLHTHSERCTFID